MSSQTQLSLETREIFFSKYRNCERGFSSGIFSQYIILVEITVMRIVDDDGKNREAQRVGWGSSGPTLCMAHCLQINQTHAVSSPRAVDLFFSCKSPFQIFIHLKSEILPKTSSQPCGWFGWYRTSRGRPETTHYGSLVTCKWFIKFVSSLFCSVFCSQFEDFLPYFLLILSIIDMFCLCSI